MEILTKDGLKLFKFIKNHFSDLTPDDARQIMRMKIKTLIKNIDETNRPGDEEFKFLKIIHKSKLEFIDKCILKILVYYNIRNHDFPGYANFTFLETDRESDYDKITWGNCWIYAYIALKSFDYKIITTSYYSVYYPILYLKLLSQYPEAEKMTFTEFFKYLTKQKIKYKPIKIENVKKWIDKNIIPGDILFINQDSDKEHAWPMLECGLLLEINQSCLINSKLISEKPPLQTGHLQIAKIHIKDF